MKIYNSLLIITTITLTLFVNNFIIYNIINNKELKRGDKITIDESYIPEFYKNCNVTFIASQKLEHGEVGFLLFQDCDIQKQYPQIFGKLYVDKIDIRYIKKVN